MGFKNMSRTVIVVANESLTLYAAQLQREVQRRCGVRWEICVMTNGITVNDIYEQLTGQNAVVLKVDAEGAHEEETGYIIDSRDVDDGLVITLTGFTPYCLRAAVLRLLKEIKMHDSSPLFSPVRSGKIVCSQSVFVTYQGDLMSPQRPLIL